MKIGMPIWYGNKSLEKAFKRAEKLGFDYVEISLDYPWHPNQKLINLLKKLRKKYKLELAFHLPIPELNLCHPLKEISTPPLLLCKKFIRELSKVNPLYINLHLTAEIMTVKFREVWEEIIKKAEKVAIELHNFSNKYNILLTFENGTYHSIGKNFKDLNFLFKRKLSLCLDLGHVAIVTYKSKKSKQKSNKKLLKILKKFGEIVYVIHLHDVAKVKGEVVDHLALGSGMINLKKIAKAIKKTKFKYLLLECYHNLKNGKIIPIKVTDLKNCLKICRELLD